MIFHPILSLLEIFYIELMVIRVLIGPSICGPAFTDSSGIAIIMKTRMCASEVPEGREEGREEGRRWEAARRSGGQDGLRRARGTSRNQSNGHTTVTRRAAGWDRGRYKLAFEARSSTQEEPDVAAARIWERNAAPGRPGRGGGTVLVQPAQNKPPDTLCPVQIRVSTGRALANNIPSFGSVWVRSILAFRSAGTVIVQYWQERTPRAMRERESEIDATWRQLMLSISPFFPPLRLSRRWLECPLRGHPQSG
ncbi:hypothetical protein FB451DRAFT_1185650 [Mycena latifolia]|nr:hypothetical protein FB451DRAFT_1185650 [Mycena latifolia]